MQNGIGRSAHGNVETHRILKSGTIGNISWKYGGVVFDVITSSEINDHSARF
jgi:hypothetical protein